VFAGELKNAFTVAGTTDYFVVFMVPAVITLLAGVAFAAFFREERV
jgi:hypothetical protein